MSVKEDTRKRQSVTPKESTATLLDEMKDASGLSTSNLFNIAIDILHFVWSVIRRGGVIGVKFENDQDFKPVQIYIPGLTKPAS